LKFIVTRLDGKPRGTGAARFRILGILNSPPVFKRY